MNNIKINGIHHISMKCSKNEFQKAYDFYVNLLGLKLYNKWENGIMLKAGNDIIEIFHNGEILPKGIIRHFAFEVENTKKAIEEIRKNGYEIIIEPKEINLNGLKAIIAFIVGPIGEEIELFQPLNRI